jgi:glyceraldehyde 3-phosphate dehydrogenase
MVRIGINGWGRISTCVMRAARLFDDVEIAAINWRNADYEYVKYLLKYDTTYGRFPAEIDTYENGIVVDGKKIPVFFEEDPSCIPWGECGADYIIDGTGALTSSEKCQPHLDAGAKKVIISAPAKDKETPTFVFGVNHDGYNKDMKIVSAASCTTNCLAPLCKVIDDKWGIETGLMTTIHASTGKQKTNDGRSNKDWRVGRAVYNNIIPTTTGAAKAVGKVIPDLNGKLTGMSFRVPAIDVSVVDLDVVLKNPASYDEICKAMKEASEGELKGILAYTDEPVVSMDFIGDSHPSIFDAKMGIEVNDKFFKVIAYYDNEFGYTCNMLRLIRHMAEVDAK